MLKLASLSLAALLALASPVVAIGDIRSTPAPKAECLSPDKFKSALRLEGDKLALFRKTAVGLPAEVDLVVIVKAPPIAIAFVKGCAVGYGSLGPVSPKPADDGSI